MTYRLYISLVFALLSLPAFSDDFVKGGLGYTILDSELWNHTDPVVEVSNNSINIKSITAARLHIPTTVTWGRTTYTVIGIGYKAFEDLYVHSVVLPEKLEYIDDYAFMNIWMPPSTDLLRGYIEIPDGVYLLGKGIFENGGIEHVKWPANIDYIPERSCKGIKGMCSTGIVPEGITKIGEYAFSGCIQCDTHDIKDSNEHVFTFPVSLITIERYAFSECTSLKGISFQENVRTIDDGAFSGCKNLKSIIFNEGLETLGDRVFMNCNSLNDVPALPRSLTSIGIAAFKECYSLCNVHILESSMTVLSDSLFYGCDNLESITIPANIRCINSHAFGNCYALRTVKVMGDLEFIDIDAFTIRSDFNCYSLRDFYCHSSSVPKIHPAAFCAGWSMTRQNSDDMQVIYEGKAYYIPLTFEFKVHDFDGNYDYSKEYPYDIYVRNATLHVPRALVNKYRTTFPWSMFGSIVAIEDEEADGIFQTVADRLSPRDAIYDINGRRLNEMHKGINIINGRKILVRP